MNRKADTHIRVQESTWSRLNARKRPGDSFDDVIVRLLDEAEDDGGSDGAREPDAQTDDQSDSSDGGRAHDGGDRPASAD